jgi:hypothetical protein
MKRGITNIFPWQPTFGKTSSSAQKAWGTAVVNVLKVFHHAIMYLQQGKLPDQDF